MNEWIVEWRESELKLSKLHMRVMDAHMINE